MFNTMGRFLIKHSRGITTFAIFDKKTHVLLDYSLQNVKNAICAGCDNVTMKKSGEKKVVTCKRESNHHQTKEE